MEGLDPRDVGRILDSLLAQGMVLPLQMVSVGLNGALMAGSFVTASSGEGLEFKQTALQGGDFQLPINMMFVDAKGEAARVLIEQSQEPQIFTFSDN